MKKAVELWQKAADLGNTSAMCNLALMYKNGDYVDKNMKKAVELWQKAADLGDMNAINNLALMYKNGDGVDKDMKKVMELCQKAADLGNPNAIKLIEKKRKIEDTSSESNKSKKHKSNIEEPIGPCFKN